MKTAKPIGRGYSIEYEWTEPLDNAFQMCSALTYVYPPETVTKIGNDVFAGCEALEAVTYSGSHEQWDEIKINEGNTSARGCRKRGSLLRIE